jgi:hypothetical protein
MAVVASVATSVSGPTEGEESDKLNLQEGPYDISIQKPAPEAAATSEDAQLLEILPTTPQVFDLYDNHVIGHKDLWL